MTVIQLLNIWTPYEALNVIIWLVLSIAILYLARKPAHAAVQASCRLVRHGLAHTARAILSAETAVQQRNREVLFTAGLDAAEKQIEKEFFRINTAVERDLGGFPSLRRRILEQIDRIDADYRQSSDIPPSPPEWVGALNALAGLPRETLENKAVSAIMKDIHQSTCAQHTQAMEEYRSAVAKHHDALHRLLPYWRSLTRTLDSVGKIVSGIRDRSTRIDRKMDEYEAIRNRTNRAERALSASSMTRFFISGLGLFIAVWGIVVNVHLVAPSMAELMDPNGLIGPLKSSDAVTLIIILLEVSIGVYLMESMGITDLFPVIGQMDDATKRRMTWVMLSFLVILAGISSSLAVLGAPPVLSREDMIQALSGQALPVPEDTLIPTLGRMALTFILPFILALTAIPLSAFVLASRTVLGIVVAFAMRLAAFFLTLSGTLIMGIGDLMVRLYDLLIFPPLWVEEILTGTVSRRAAVPAATETVTPSPIGDQPENGEKSS
ncbi:hypothetical protein JCM14469_32160 [Desulfatiferula olefinivorans]